MSVTLHRPFQAWKPEHRKQHAPVLDGLEGDVRLIDADTGELVAAQIMLPSGFDANLRLLGSMLRTGIRWDDGGPGGTSQARLNGMRYVSKVFGFTEPKPLRRRYGCSAALLNRENPPLASLLEKLTADFWGVFCEASFARANAQLDIVNTKVHPDWLMAGLPFTSGIINNTAALPYHRDSGNINGSWSMMLCLRNRVEGGGLHLPEYGVTLGIPNASLTIFDGNTTWHGVTPFNTLAKNGYRFTLVWYAKAGMAAGGPRKLEAARAAKMASRKVP